MAPVASYSYDEAGLTVKDYSGTNDFSIAGTGLVRNGAGHTSGGLSSTGAAKAILPNIGQTPNRTIMSWIKGVELMTDGWVIEWHVASIDSGSWGILKLAGQLHIQARNAGGIARASAPLPVDNAWHHYAGRYDGTNVEILVDGILVASTPLAGPLRSDADPPTIGGWTELQPILDDTRIDNGALNDSAINLAKNTPVSSGAVSVALSISDQARANMLTALALVDPQNLSNVDLMKRVMDAGGLALVIVTNLTAAEQYSRYVESLSA